MTTDLPERIVLTDQGFELTGGAALKGSVLWREVERIAVYKEDLITTDLICMAFFIAETDQCVTVHEEIEGYLEMTLRLKQALPASKQDWEIDVMSPAFARNLTVIYRRP